MKQKFKNSNEAIDAIITSSKMHALATDKGDYKMANKNYSIVSKAYNYLKENGEINKLETLINYDDTSVKIAVASFLVKDSNPKAVLVLKEIASKSIPHHSFAAQILLQQLKEGKYK